MVSRGAACLRPAGEAWCNNLTLTLSQQPIQKSDMLDWMSHSVLPTERYVVSSIVATKTAPRFSTHTSL